MQTYYDDDYYSFDGEEYSSSEDTFRPSGSSSYFQDYSSSYGALNYKPQSNGVQIVELYENSKEELLIIKKTTPKPLKEPRLPTSPFLLRLQRLFSNRKVVFLKWIKSEILFLLIVNRWVQKI